MTLGLGGTDVELSQQNNNPKKNNKNTTGCL